MGNKGNIALVLTYEGSLPGKRFIDDLLFSDKYGSWSDFQADWRIANGTAQITPYDGQKDIEDIRKDVEAKLSRANSTLTDLIGNVQNSYKDMNSNASKYKWFGVLGLGVGAGFLGVGVGMGIKGAIIEAEWLCTASLGVLITSASFINNIYHRQSFIGSYLDSLLEDCYRLQKTIANTASTYKIKSLEHSEELVRTDNLQLV